MHINAAKLKDKVEYIQDSPEERKYLAEKAGKESAAMPAMELPDGGIIMFPEEVNPMHVNTAAPILGGSSCHSLPCLAKRPETLVYEPTYNPTLICFDFVV